MNKKALFIILGIVAALVLAALLYIFVFNKTKDPITENDFINIMEEKGYVVTDVLTQFAGYDVMEKAYIAQASDNLYQIEFFILANEEEAEAMFDNNKNIFEEGKTNVSTQTEVTGKNFKKFTLNTNNKYQVISRIDSTLMYVNVDETNKDEVKTLLKELGY